LQGLPWWRAVNTAVSFLVFTILFAMIYKVLPDVELRWRNVWIGGMVTAALFTLGKYLIGLYLAYAGVGSPYGAAGSLAVLLAWIYYSSLIFLYGAEFTRVYMEAGGAQAQPSSLAERVCADGTSRAHTQPAVRTS
jgi:membrane protein